MNERALIQAIQRKVGARPDGDVGAETLRCIAGALGVDTVAEAPRTVAAGMWPVDRAAEMEAFYGRPGDETKLEVWAAPYTLHVGGQPTGKIRTHRKIVEPVRRVLEKTLEFYGLVEIRRLRLDVYDGCFNPRPKRGGTSWSTHAYGAALDFGAEWNSLHQDHRTALYAGAAYEQWWRFWEDEGAVSLGRSRDFDWMHVQFARLP